MTVPQNYPRRNSRWNGLSVTLALALVALGLSWILTAAMSGGDNGTKTVAQSDSHKTATVSTPHWQGTSPVVKGTDDDSMVVEACAKGLTPQEISFGHVTTMGTSMKLKQHMDTYDGSQVNAELTGNVQSGVSLEAIIAHSSGPSTTGTSNDVAVMTHAGPHGILDQKFETARFVYDGDSDIYSVTSVVMCLYDPHHLVP